MIRSDHEGWDRFGTLSPARLTMIAPERAVPPMSPGSNKRARTPNQAWCSPRLKPRGRKSNARSSGVKFGRLRSTNVDGTRSRLLCVGRVNRECANELGSSRVPERYYAATGAARWVHLQRIPTQRWPSCVGSFANKGQSWSQRVFSFSLISGRRDE